MRLTARSTLLALCCLATAAGFLPIPLPGDAAARLIAEELRAETGLATRAEGPATLTLLPLPRVHLGALSVGGPDAAVSVLSPGATLGLGLGRLMAGRPSLASLTLERPTISVDFDAVLPRQGGALARARSAPRSSIDAARADTERLPRLRILDGLIHVVSKANGLDTLIEAKDASLDWPRIGGSAAISGHMAWRGVEGDVALWVSQGGALLRGEDGRAMLAIRSNAGNLSFAGNAGGVLARLSGRMSLAIPSPSQVMRLFDLALPFAELADNLSLAADLRASGREATLTDVQLKAGPNAYEGNLALTLDDGRPRLTATLATPVLTLIAPKDSLGGGGATEASFDRVANQLVRSLVKGELDLRISATRALLGQMDMADAAFSLLSSGGRLEIALSDARLYGGAAKAKLTLAPAGPGLEARAVASLGQADIRPLATALGLPLPLSGTASGQISAETSGGDGRSLLAELRGRGSMTLRQGEITGLDLEGTLRKAERRGIAALAELRGSRTAFDVAEGSVTILNGVMNVADFKARGPGVEVSGALQAALDGSQCEGHANARLTGKPGDQAEGLTLSLRIKGPFARPDLRASLDKP